MKKGRIFVLLLLAFSPSAFKAQEKEKGLAAIKIETVQAQMEFLASDWTEGRETGKKGIFMAADYIASMFKLYGIQPAGDETWVYPNRDQRMKGMQAYKKRSFFQEIPFVETSLGEIQVLNIISSENGIKTSIGLGFETDYSVYGTDCSQEFEAPVIFVGYGLQDTENAYDDFKGIDVKGKIVLRLNGFPGHKDTNSVAYKKFKPKDRYGMYMLNRKKNETAQKLGAVAIIDYNADYDPSLDWTKNLPFRYNSEYYEGDEEQKTSYDNRLSLQGKEIGKNLLRIILSKRAMNALIKNSGIDFQAVEQTIQNQMKSQSKPIAGKSIYVNSTIKSKIVNCRNVLGMIEGENKNEWVVLGAHYDHLGKYNGIVWNGADDNASGTVGVMTIAKALSESGKKPEKTIIFALWTGEEKGLLGSRYFVENQLSKPEKMVFNLNYDMISRDDDTDTAGVECSMSYLEGYDKLTEIAKKNNSDFNTGLKVRYRKSAPGSGGGSDHAPFSQEKIPFIYFMAGFQKEYHQPGDHSDKINWKKMTNIIKLGYLNVWDVANTKGEIGK